jgi:hypothetical protein
VKRFSKLFFLFPLIALLSCTNNPPHIRDSWWLPLTVKEQDGGSHKELMLYVQVDDEEGVDDLAELRLENLHNGVVWKIDRSNWSVWKNKGVHWVGSSGIVSYGSALTEGPYRLILEDKGGREDQIPLELEGWFEEDISEEHTINYDKETGRMIITSPVDSWFLLSSEDEDNFTPEPVSLGEPFFPATLLDNPRGSFYLLLFERDSMAAFKVGPYSYLSAE